LQLLITNGAGSTLRGKTEIPNQLAGGWNIYFRRPIQYLGDIQTES
jgi:hypothetical protein